MIARLLSNFGRQLFGERLLCAANSGRPDKDAIELGCVKTCGSQPSTKRSSAVGSGSNFFKGRLSMPGTTPAASQLDWLISSTTTMVLFCSKAIRERLRSSTWVMGAPHSVFAQRQRCQTFAAVPIASGPKADTKHWAATVERSIAVQVRASDIDHSVAGRPASSLTTLARNRSSQR